jgi:hypothetical protein
MTAPQPPAIDPIVEFTHTMRDRAEIVIARLHLKYLLAIICGLGAICYGGSKAYSYYDGRVARLESQRSVLEQRAAASEKAGDIWRTQALALARTRAVDTVRTDSIITNTVTNVVTVPIPVLQPNGTVSEIPTPMVPLVSFNALGNACTRERHDCTLLVAAKDALIDSLDSRGRSLEAINHNVGQQLGATKRANFWTKISWGSGGAAAGFATGFAAGTASCHR